MGTSPAAPYPVEADRSTPMPAPRSPRSHPDRRAVHEAAAWRPLLDGAGVDGPEGLVLAALWRADGATEASLAQRTAVSVDAVHRLVETLGLLGYVEPEADGVWLTGDGFRLRNRALARVTVSLN